MHWTSDDAETPPGPIPVNHQHYSVVVPLIDEHFAANKNWRDWIDQIDSDECHLRFWAVHSAAFQIDRLSSMNSLGTGPCRSTALQRQLTQSCALLLLNERTEGSTNSLKFFISYARKDGLKIASRVRTALLEYGNIQVFMDVHDIEAGSGWQESLSCGLDSGAAMLAIVTDTYSERAWCRHELRNFKTPVPISEGTSETGQSRWWLKPVFVLDALSGIRSRSMFEVGSTPIIRWSNNRSKSIIDTLLRDILFGEVQRHRAKAIPVTSGLVINWEPDTWTLLELQRVAITSHNNESGVLHRIIHPGDGLPRMEVERLQAVFPNLELCAFDDASYD